MVKWYKKFLDKAIRKILGRAYRSNKKTVINLKNVLLSDKKQDEKILAILLSDIKNNPDLSRLLSNVVINDYYKTNRLETDYDKYLGGENTYIENNIESEKKVLHFTLMGVLTLIFLILLSLLGNGIFTLLFTTFLLSTSIIISTGILSGFLAQLYEVYDTSVLYRKKDKASKKLLKDLNIAEPDATHDFLLTLMAINKFDDDKMKEIEQILATFSTLNITNENPKRVSIKEAKETIDKMKEKLLIELNK